MPEVGEAVSNAVIPLNLPEFYKHFPTTWFLQIETLFRLDGITRDSSKLKHLIRSLPSYVLESISDVLGENSDATYEAVKAVITNKFSPNITQKMQLLSQNSELDHLHPIELLRKLKQVLGDTISPELLRETFIMRLPKNLHNLIDILGPDVPIEQLATAAGRAISRCQFDVSAVSPAEDTRQIANQMKALTESLNSLRSQITEEIQLIKTRLNKIEKRGRSHSRGRSNNNRSNSRLQTNGLCWYHDNWGERARRCEEGCLRYSTSNSNAPSGNASGNATGSR